VAQSHVLQPVHEELAAQVRLREQLARAARR
jgi:hypothetical protein